MKIKLDESGIRNIRELAKNYDKSIIYGHMDLDGLASSICAKSYLERYGIKTVDFQIIQYGATEFAISKPTDPKTMGVLVDFAHGKPFMKIHTDHHQNQIVMKGSSNQFAHTESNASTWSTTISTSDIFPPEDIRVINMVDAAQYNREGVKPDEMMKASISVDKEKSVLRNHIEMGMACGKLVLAYKNKPGFFKEVVMRANPSLESMYNTIIKIIKEKIASGERNWVDSSVIEDNAQKYWEDQSSKKIQDGTIDDIDNISNGQSILIDDIIFQCGGGNTRKTGGYDRYTAFRLYPNAKYFIMLWDSIGMMQVSKNPWNENNKENINLGELVLDDIFKKKVAPKLHTDKYKISLLAIKRVNESQYNAENNSIGFDYDGMIAVYPKLEELFSKFSPRYQNVIRKYMNWKPNDFVEQSSEEVKKALDILGRKLYVYLSDIVIENSGGHPSITNLSGFDYLNEELRLRKKLENNKNPYIKPEVKKDEKTDKEKNKLDDKPKKDNLSTVILKSIAKDVIRKLQGQEIKKPKRVRKSTNRAPKNESISNERLANREAIKYMKTLDNKILENLNPVLEEDFYIFLSNKYDNYEYKRNIYSKNEVFKSLCESLKNKNVSDSLKSFIKNILI